uniref:Uncharacterized protein n=1 Tax=Aegilops tauschii TaxID=37682 RepID=M8BX63_AEGTA
MDGSDGNGICFPYDVLLNILGRLQCRPLAKSRRVCRAWRAIVDGHKLLLRGHIFRRPLFRHDSASMPHYCNCLLLLEESDDCLRREEALAHSSSAARLASPRLVTS